MMSKIVVVDDSQADLKLIEEYLKSRAPYGCVVFRCDEPGQDKLVKDDKTGRGCVWT